jgi:hypothetical protein
VQPSEICKRVHLNGSIDAVDYRSLYSQQKYLSIHAFASQKVFKPSITKFIWTAFFLCFYKSIIAMGRSPLNLTLASFVLRENLSPSLDPNLAFLVSSVVAAHPGTFTKCIY